MAGLSVKMNVVMRFFEMLRALISLSIRSGHDHLLEFSKI
jgi:hypothetical protein